jgi:peptidoglycan/xylan/chitin deacetylase (PgdA/CDA1 family)
VRDLVGYGANPPRVEWPGGARLAVNVVVNYEEGSERNPLEGDRDVEPLVDSRYVVPPGERDLHMESSYEYGSRVGVWRVLRALDELEISPTVFACGMALERNPEAVAAFVERGCDVAGHGYRWIPHMSFTPAEQEADIRRCLDVIEAMTGQRARGWFGRAPNTVHTRRLLAEAGLLYDSGSVSDDLPYFTDVGGRPFLVVPYSLDVNDVRFWKGELVTGDQFESYVRDSFEVLYAESAETPRMMSIGLHPRIVGRPGRLAALRRVLTHIHGHDGVWFAKRDEIARVWVEQFGPDDLWNRA